VLELGKRDQQHGPTDGVQLIELAHRVRRDHSVERLGVIEHASEQLAKVILIDSTELCHRRVLFDELIVIVARKLPLIERLD
jgi:hypothetical protein